VTLPHQLIAGLQCMVYFLLKRTQLQSRLLAHSPFMCVERIVVVNPQVALCTRYVLASTKNKPTSLDVLHARQYPISASLTSL
jgi:hypothetical protein